MAFVLKSGTKVQLAFELTDADGNIVTPVETPVWSSSDPTVVEVTADGSASDPVGAGLGTATISATADGFTGVLDIMVVAGDAAFANITPGTPEPR